jgi:hypothetical protein
MLLTPSLWCDDTMFAGLAGACLPQGTQVRHRREICLDAHRPYQQPLRESEVVLGPELIVRQSAPRTHDPNKQRG